MIENIIYQSVTPKYIKIYEPIYFEKFGVRVGCLYINKRDMEITKRHMSFVKKEDTEKFLRKNRPINEMVEGADIVAKLILNHGRL